GAQALLPDPRRGAGTRGGDAVPGRDAVPVSVAFSIGLDPDRVRYDWVDPPAGGRLVRVPTEDVVSLVGFRAYQELVLDVCAVERIGVLVTHPPFDYLDEPTAERLRAGGTRIVGLALHDYDYGYDRAELGRVFDRYVIIDEIKWATA